MKCTIWLADRKGTRPVK